MTIDKQRTSAWFADNQKKITEAKELLKSLQDERREAKQGIELINSINEMKRIRSNGFKNKASLYAINLGIDALEKELAEMSVEETEEEEFQTPPVSIAAMLVRMNMISGNDPEYEQYAQHIHEFHNSELSADAFFEKHIKGMFEE